MNRDLIEFVRRRYKEKGFYSITIGDKHTENPPEIPMMTNGKIIVDVRDISKEFQKFMRKRK